MNYLLRKSMNNSYIKLLRRLHKTGPEDPEKEYWRKELDYYIISFQLLWGSEDQFSLSEQSYAPFGSSSIKVTQENLVELISPSDGERTMSTGTGRKEKLGSILIRKDSIRIVIGWVPFILFLAFSDYALLLSCFFVDSAYISLWRYGSQLPRSGQELDSTLLSSIAT